MRNKRFIAAHEPLGLIALNGKCGQSEALKPRPRNGSILIHNDRDDNKWGHNWEHCQILTLSNIQSIKTFFTYTAVVNKSHPLHWLHQTQWRRIPRVEGGVEAYWFLVANRMKYHNNIIYIFHNTPHVNANPRDIEVNRWVIIQLPQSTAHSYESLSYTGNISINNSLAMI